MDISYPETYRQEYFSKIARLILHGESMLILGPAGIGKTSDLQFLLQNNASLKKYFYNSEVKLLWIGGDGLYDSSFQKYMDTLNDLSRSTSEHIVIIIDHTDRLSSENYKPLFAAIRAMRESTRPRTSVICVSDKDLTKDPLNSLLPIEPLLLENIVVIPPLSVDDTKMSLALWEKYYDVKLDKKVEEQIISASGGIPRLIKRLTKLAADKQDVLEVIKNPISDLKLKLDLENIAVFNRANPEYFYKIPLLEHLEGLTNTDFDQIGSVKFYSRLSRQEYLLAQLLIEKRGQLVSREEMITTIWPKNILETSEHALDQMIHRVRKKLESAKPKCELVVFRGRGVKLSL